MHLGWNLLRSPGVSQAARSLAALEAVFGQLYLAILVGRLAGLHISQRG